MTQKTLEGVRTPNGPIEYQVTWNTDSGEVHVANEYAGTASNEKEAWAVANYYATTGTADYKPVNL